MRLDVLALETTHPIKLAGCGVSDQTEKRLRELADVDFVQIASDEESGCALDAVPYILSGRCTPWANFRQDALAPVERFRAIRKPLVAIVAAGILFLLCVSGAFLWQANRHSAWVSHEEQQQRQIFRKTFPGQRAPAAVLRRMRSELRRIQAISGQSNDLPPQISALSLMFESLRRLPKNLRYRVVDLRFGENGIYLEGETRSHADADSLAAALRHQNGFDVQPPRSEEREGKKVSFVLTGKIRTDKSQLAKAVP
jgi:hypothetical protein